MIATMAGIPGWLAKVYRRAKVFVPTLTQAHVSALHDLYVQSVTAGTLPRFDGTRLVAGQETYKAMIARAGGVYPAPVIFAYLRALWASVAAGEIDRSHYDPRGARAAAQARQAFTSEQTFAERTGNLASLVGGAGKWVVIGAIAVAVALSAGWVGKLIPKRGSHEG